MQFDNGSFEFEELLNAAQPQTGEKPINVDQRQSLITYQLDILIDRRFASDSA